MLAVVVEDEWLIRMQIADSLVDAGWEVQEFSSGEKALSFLQQHRPIMFLVTDIYLTGTVTGWDVAEAYRIQNPDVKVVYCFGNPPDRTRQVPQSNFLPKPCQIGAILRAGMA